MKWLLGRIGLPKAIGLYVGDEVVALSQVVSTPFGPMEIARREERLSPEGLPETLKRLLQPMRGSRRCRRIPVAVSVPAHRVFFVTRPIQNASRDPSPQVLLREALRSASVSIDEMVVDVIKAQPDRRLVASIAACDRRYIVDLVDALRESGVRPVRVEPAPCALRRAALTGHRAPHGAKVVLRLFLSESESLAVLVVNNLPVLWRFLDLHPGDESSAILLAARSMIAVAKDCGVDWPLDAVVLHGHRDLARLLDIAWVREQTGVPVQWHAQPALEGCHIAFGSAAGCWKPEEQAFDFSRSLKPCASFWEIIPWCESVVHVALLGCMLLLLGYRWAQVNDAYSTMIARNAQNASMASLAEPELERHNAEYRERVAALQKFLDSRISWAAYQRELAACLPPNAVLTSFQGLCELETSEQKADRAKTKKSMVLQGKVRTSGDQVIPREIDQFLDKLRAHPRLKGDFPVVELTELKQSKYQANDAPAASFTVVCLPKRGKDKTKTVQEVKSESISGEKSHGI